MSTPSQYIHNSNQKDIVRQKWIEFAREIYPSGSTHEFGILTFPAEAMQDLHLFRNEGFISWEEVETESKNGFNYRITKGKIRCFEKNTTIQRILSQKLIEAKVDGEFSPYIAANYSKILSGKDKTFPVDVINLDYDGRLQPNLRYPFESTIENIFKFQSTHKKHFSLFITWPVTEEEDIEEYKTLLNEIISSNLIDPSAQKFKEQFENNLKSIEHLKYEVKSIIAVSKVIIKKASQNLFSVGRSEFLLYGGKDHEKKRMISVLYNFKFDGRKGRENIIYAEDVVHALNTILEINS